MKVHTVRINHKSTKQKETNFQRLNQAKHTKRSKFLQFVPQRDRNQARARSLSAKYAANSRRLRPRRQPDYCHRRRRSCTAPTRGRGSPCIGAGRWILRRRSNVAASPASIGGGNTRHREFEIKRESERIIRRRFNSVHNRTS